jgi:hypothetical protein
VHQSSSTLIVTPSPKDSTRSHRRCAQCFHFVRRYGLGLVVDCNDSRAFRDALLELTTNADATEHHAASLSGFAARFSRERFAEAVLKPSLGEAGAAVEQRAAVTIRLDTREG